ncbi:MAG TPA: diguanylate cyclase, partial [Acidimicrobiales bacterium]
LQDAGYEVGEAATGLDGIQAALATRPDVVLLDLVLPDLPGMEVLRRMRSHDLLTSTAVVIVSERVRVADVAAVLQAGAHDYLRKPVETGELIARVTAAGRAKRLHDEVLGHRAAPEEARRTDHVTGLPNRLHLDEYLQMGMALARRYGTPLAALALDVDHLKRINDGGRQRGDAVLALIGGALRDALRQEDLVGRWGGDEFLALLLGDGASDVVAPAHRILSSVRQLPRVHGMPPVTVSIGAALYVPPEDGRSLVRRADAALYAAQVSGRDTMVVAAPPGETGETGETG